MNRSIGGLGDAVSVLEGASIKELRAVLDQKVYSDAETLTSKVAIDTLRCIRDVLDVALGDTIFTQKIEVHLQHKAIEVLDSVIEALEDLDKGVVHEALQSSSSNRGAALTAEQKRQDIQWLNNVTIVQRWKGLKTRHEAEVWYAERLRKAGKKRRGDEPTAVMLKSLRDHPKN